MRASYKLQDIIKDLVGRYDAVGESHIDGPTLDSLKIALPQLYAAVELVFREMPYELSRHEGSIIEIGQAKLEWANEFKELFEYIVPEKECVTNGTEGGY